MSFYNLVSLENKDWNYRYVVHKWKMYKTQLFIKGGS